MKTVLVILLYLFKNTHTSSPRVRVEQGELLGKKHFLSNGKVINAFLGIPFAIPPTYENRFKDPQKPIPWNGVRNAIFHRNSCLQLIYTPKIIYTIQGNEDCLYLNIYTPKLPTNGINPLLNVFVYIHAGAFTFGSANVFPDRILTIDDVVFVSISYRLGVFGFLSTNDDELPGNFGLKDQVAALKWINQNIINFGGNPKSITIVGTSSGAVSVHYHLLSAMSEGLFQKAISFSGTAFVPWALSENATEKSLHFATLVGCPTTNTQNMAKCLRQKPPSDLIEASKNFMTWRFAPLTLFGPVIEPVSPNAFLSEHPYNLIRNGKVKDIPWMASVVKDEGMCPLAEFIHSDVYLNELNNNWNEIAPNLFDYNYSVPEYKKDEVSRMIRKFYFAEKSISKNTIKELAQLTSDRLMNTGFIEGIRFQNLAIKSKIYCAKFNYRGTFSYSNIYAGNKKNYGVIHGDDLQYFIKSSPYENFQEKSDLEVSKLLSSIIVVFMNSGNPNKVVPKWQPVKKELNTELDCLFINSAADVRMGKIPINSTNMQFWKSIIPWENPVVYENYSYQTLITQFLLIFTIFIIIAKIFQRIFEKYRRYTKILN